MQEELEKKTVVVITTGAKLTERLLKSLIRKALAEMQRQTQNPKAVSYTHLTLPTTPYV